MSVAQGIETSQGQDRGTATITTSGPRIEMISVTRNLLKMHAMGSRREDQADLLRLMVTGTHKYDLPPR